MTENPSQTPGNPFSSFPPGSAKTKEVAEWLANIAKISTVMSAILGGPIIWLYLISAGAAFPTPDASLAVLLLAFSVMLTGIFAILLTSLLIPILVRLGAVEAVRVRFPLLFRETPPIGLDIPKFLLEYALLHLPSLSFILSIFFVFNPGKEEEKIIPLIAFIVGLALSITAEVYKKLRRRAKLNDEFSSVFWFRLLINLSFCGWFLYFTSLVIFPATRLIPQNIGIGETLASLMVTVGVIVPHMFLSWGRPTARRVAIGAGFGVLALSFAYPGIPSLASSALNVLGFGGGVPVTLTVKRLEADQTTAIGRQVSGCLILKTGSTVTIREQRKNADDCGLHPRFLEPFQFAPRFQDVIEFQRADVTEIGAYRPTFAIP